MEHLQNSSIQSSEYRDLPLAQLVESATNPRKHYDQDRLADLAESIRAQTVLEPLLVRQLSDEDLKSSPDRAVSEQHSWQEQARSRPVFSR